MTTPHGLVVSTAGERLEVITEDSLVTLREDGAALGFTMSVDQATMLAEALLRATSAAAKPIELESVDGAILELRRLIERTFVSADAATMLVRDMGFPPGRIPDFKNSEVFWAKVFQELEAGLIRHPFTRLVAAARRAYPYHQLLEAIEPKVQGR